MYFPYFSSFLTERCSIVLRSLFLPNFACFNLSLIIAPENLVEIYLSRSGAFFPNSKIVVSYSGFLAKSSVSTI